MIRFVDDRRIFEEVFRNALPKARRFVWIATADIKDMHLPGRGRRYESVLGVISSLIENGIAVRLVHAKEPGPNFRKSHEKHPNLFDGMERALCPRNHMKAVIIDGKWCYMGSANMTGAGMGAKSDRRRNFEAGIITDEPDILKPLIAKYDELWMGLKCGDCNLRKTCPDPIA